ncbi:hypothetical protein [Chelativorans alearense]|uniref:hypothetical protein n=1 Tax=Chelativorans alearense TaxID=2681495 RepID=UPI00196A1153|nr:hypothetical protein [Chelativorans alearense]
MKERGDKLRARKAELTDFLATADEPPPLLHPAMAQQYRIRVQQLYETLQADSEERRVEAADVIRSLVEDIVLTPVDGKVEIDVRGDLAGILTLSAERKNPAGGAGSPQVMMVAGFATGGGRCLPLSLMTELAERIQFMTTSHKHGSLFR